MLVGGVVGDVVDDDADAVAVRLGDQPVEGRQVAEDRLDVSVVADVEALVQQRRAEEGTDPDGGDPERAGEVGQRFDQAVEVADAVAVAVLDARQVVLVEDRVAPPRRRDGVSRAGRARARSPAAASLRLGRAHAVTLAHDALGLGGEGGERLAVDLDAEAGPLRQRDDAVDQLQLVAA